MAVACYHVQQLLPLAWHNLTLDWNTFHPEPVLLLAVLIILRRPSPKSVFMLQRKSQKHLTTKVWFPSSLWARNKFLPIILMFFMVLDAFLVPIPYSGGTQCHTKTNPLLTNPCTFERAFKKEIDKMLQAGDLKPVSQETPWINSFVLVEGKDKQGNLVLRICLDPTNLNKAIVQEPYHFKTQKISPICLQKPVSLLYVIAEKVIGTSNLMKLPHYWPPLIQSQVDSNIKLCHLELL